MGDHVTDITVEVFNHCMGSCTGCLLSVQERRSVSPVMQPYAFAAAMRAVAEYGMRTGITYRPVIVYGDVPWLPVAMQRKYYEAAREVGLPLGVTMTLVEEDKSENYWQGLEAFLGNSTDPVFDVTVDPVRLFKDDSYRERLLKAAGMAPELHLQMLLSEAVLTRNEPEELACRMRDALGGRPISLGFTPALTRIEGVNFQYEVGGAAAWARRFYNATDEGARLLDAEFGRFQGGSDYADFMAQTFHVGPDLSIWPTGYTIFGDVIMDQRNGGTALGNIKHARLDDILTGREARRLATIARAGMSIGDFGCEECPHMETCTFHGVGAVRRVYKDYEHRTGSCHGPIALMEAA
jgi:hypothetical protein